MAQKQSPIFTKTYDFLLWLLQHTGKFPRNERFRLAKRLEDGIFDFYELLMESAHRHNSLDTLIVADFQLEKIRFYLRLCFALCLFNLRQYEYAANSLMEIGKLLGGWIKSATSNADVPGESGKGFAGRLVEQQ